MCRSHKEGNRPEADEEEDDNEVAADARISVGEVDDPELGQISVSAIALKRKAPKCLSNSNNRVFHAVNGQVQFKQTRGYLTDCGFPALKDRVLIIVDASNLIFAAHTMYGRATGKTSATRLWASDIAMRSPPRSRNRWP